MKMPNKRIPFQTITKYGLEDKLDLLIVKIQWHNIDNMNSIEDMWNYLSEEQQHLILNKMLEKYLDEEDYASNMIKKIHKCRWEN